MRRALARGVSIMPIVLGTALIASCVWIAACASNSRVVMQKPHAGAMQPESPMHELIVPTGHAEPIDVTEPGKVVWRTAHAEIIDTRTIPWNQKDFDAPPARDRRVREVLPPHVPPPDDFGLEPRELAPSTIEVGTTTDEVGTQPDIQWASISNTGWNPPDPTLAVGPSHVVVTVNSRIAFYTKSGSQTFIADLGSQGNPGFFEPVGGSTFCFDPKVFYDHNVQRFVVVAPEVYNSSDGTVNESWICMAVSDDSDPNGVWYKYRTDAVLNVGGVLYWWDYPGFGYDHQAWYVTSNLFVLEGSGPFGGVGHRVFNKTPMLSGQPVTFATLRDASGASVQVAQCFGTPQSPYFISRSGTSAMRVQAMLNPLTSPSLVTTTVSVPSFSQSIAAPTPTDSVPVIDYRIMNAHWRNGKLYATHGVGVGGRTLARWYQINTNNWPASGSPTLAQSGNIDPGTDMHSFYPAIYSNNLDQVAMVVGTCGPTQNVAVAVTGRQPTDPAGQMQAVQTLVTGSVGTGGRWGDYYDIAIDPVDDRTFWIVGEYRNSSGWQNWVASFLVSGTINPLHANADNAGTVVGPTTRLIDVMANDVHDGGQTFVIDSFQTTTQRGGTVSLSAGTGPNGRDQLAYSPPSGVLNANDTFTYTIRDSAGNTSSAAVNAVAHDSLLFRAPDTTGPTLTGLDVRYYALTSPTGLPDFDAMTPYLTTWFSIINFVNSTGNFANSGRADNVGARFDGFMNVPAADYYTLSLESDEGSRLFIGGQLVVNNDGLHTMTTAQGSIGLQAGLHRIRVEYFEATGPNGLILRRRGSTGTDAVVQVGELVREVACDNIDFNRDGLFPDTADIDAYLTVFGGGACPTASCNDIDFNNDGLFPDTADLDAFLRVFSGGPCWTQ